MNQLASQPKDRVLEAVAAVLGLPLDGLNDEASPSSVPSWDSLNHLNLVMALESEFGVSLSVEDALQLRDIAAIRRILKARGAQI
jgi:acyl carrier protein